MEYLLQYVNERRDDIVALIGEMVQCESPSDSPRDVNAFVDLVIEKTRDIASAETVDGGAFGKHLRLEFDLGAGSTEKQILALGHSDTVWPAGTLNEMPFRVGDGRLWGPGVLDMKAGLAFFLYAMRALRELDIGAKRRVALLIVSDEEIGSPTSRTITEGEAKRSECVLVLEPGTGLAGKLKTSRKGVGSYSVAIEGKAAHAGVDFNNGASAVIEAARQIERIAQFTDFKRGLTVNPGVISGGTRRNVIAAQARIEVDVRVVRPRDGERIDERLRALRPVNKLCKVHVEGSISRPPMERTKAIGKLFGKARKVARKLGVELGESSTGGGSDANFTAALGIPTLDGLGAVGEGAHAKHESILLDRVVDRVALLAGLVREL